DGRKQLGPFRLPMPPDLPVAEIPDVAIGDFSGSLMLPLSNHIIVNHHRHDERPTPRSARTILLAHRPLDLPYHAVGVEGGTATNYHEAVGDLYFSVEPLLQSSSRLAMILPVETCDAAFPKGPLQPHHEGRIDFRIGKEART